MDSPRRPRRRRLYRQGDSNSHDTSFTAALTVLLHHYSDYVCGRSDWESIAALRSTSRAVSRTIQQWIDHDLSEDITRGHEAMAIRAHSPQAHTVSLQCKLLLLRFRYTTNVKIPVPYDRHALPDPIQRRRRRECQEINKIERGRTVQLYASYHKDTGWGIHAAERIPTGEYVGEYTGELISSSEAQRRHRAEYDRSHTNYVLALREQSAQSHTSEQVVVVRTNVDATAYGCFTRFFNHSCEPSLRVEAVRVDSYIPRLVFFTKHTLEQGAALTFDYGCGMEAHVSACGVARDAIELAKRPCHCGSIHCRKVLPFDASL